jgi:maltodextrin utilization protein YvdJ
MNILETLVQLRDDLKTWVTNNLNALNAKIDEKTIPIDKELSATSTNPVQNKTITNAINNIPRFSGSYNDLTDAPNIAEDDSGNMIITDESGNIIFKADAEGIHTTAVSLNGEAAATEKYVDDAVANIDIPEVDFTGYATETYVAEEIAKIPKTDLTGYATEDFVGTAVDSAKEELSESIVAESDEWKVVDESGNIIFSVDASGAHTTELTLNGESAATESYVDNAIANIEFPTTDLTGYATEQWVENKNYLTEHQDISGKSDKGHKHTITDITDFTGYATETYVDNKVADLVNSAPEALNTLGELATALENHEDAYDALLETVGSKATHKDLENLKEELSDSIVSETDEWKVVDENGNIIFNVDADGAHTTSLTLNGQSVEDMIDDKVDKVEGKGLSTNDFTNAYKEKLDGLENMTFEESDPTVPAWAKEATKPSYTADEVGALADTTVLADLTDDTTHRTVTDAEKAAWNAKSDFSGDYNDLENAPNITEDASNNLVITDPSGNIIFRSDANGFETTQMVVQSLIVNGKTIEEMIQEYVNAAILGGEW